MTISYFQVDTRNEHLVTLAGMNSSLWGEFNHKLDISWIYHDHGLEGVVLQVQEIAVALNQKVISDNTFLPTYQEIKNCHQAILLLREVMESPKREKITRDLLQRCYGLLSQRLRGVPEGDGVRQDDNRYGAYYHRCCPYQEVDAALDACLKEINQMTPDEMHPIVMAARAHGKLMQIMPYGRFSGRIARWVSNLLLMREGFPPAILHTAERARYYEALAQEDEAELLVFFTEAVNATVESGLQFIGACLEDRRKKREARKATKQKNEEAAAKRHREISTKTQSSRAPRKQSADTPTGKKVRSASKRR